MVRVNSGDALNRVQLDAWQCETVVGWTSLGVDGKVQKLRKKRP